MTAEPPYTVTRDCPVACLAPLLTRPTFDALAAGVVGHNDAPATVGQVIELYEQNLLRDVRNIGPSRAGEIRRALVQAGLIEPNTAPLAMRWVRNGTESDGHHQHAPDTNRPS